jgi:hypothetical protein
LRDSPLCAVEKRRKKNRKGENHPFLVLDGGKLSKEAGLVMIKSTYEQQRKRFGLSEVSDIGEQKKNECTKLDSSILLLKK